MALPKNRGDREYEKFVEDASGNVALRTSVVVQDISIGAVEIKDHTSDNRTHVTASKELTTINPALALLVGEVQASPTANTVLARLKDLLTSINSFSKGEDAQHVSADVGIMALTVRKDDAASTAGADGDYAALITNEDGILRTQSQQHLHIEECGATAGWTVLGNDTTSLATTVNHIFGTVALEFDKVNGAANTKLAGIQKTLTSIDLTPYHKGGGFFLSKYYVSSIADVDYLFLRLGTNSSNYNEWQVSVDNLAVGWNSIRFPMASPDSIVGNGWNSAAVTYIAVGVAFGVETDTLADIAVDHISANTGLLTSADIAATITSVVSTPNINLLKVKNKVVNTEAGNVGTGTQRVTVATDDVNLAAIKSAIEGTLTVDGSGVTQPASVDKIGTGTIVNVTVPITASGASDLIAAPSAGNHLRIKAFSISSDDAADSEVELRDDTTAKFKFNIPKDGGNVVVNLIGANWELTSNKKLTANTAGVTDLHINISYEVVSD